MATTMAVPLGCDDPPDDDWADMADAATAGKADDVDAGKPLGLDPDRETEKVIERGDDAWQAYTDIVVEATPEQVWDVLTDFDAMPRWSTSLQRIDGELADGASVVVTFTIFGTTFELPHTLLYRGGGALRLGRSHCGVRRRHRPPPVHRG